MPSVSLAAVTVAFGERTVLDAVNLTVAAGQRTALVGPNGSGKTTLMRMLARQTKPDTGSVIWEKGVRVAYVPQTGVTHEGRTLLAEAETAFSYGESLLTEIRALEERLSAATEGTRETETLLARHHELSEALSQCGYWAREEAMDRVLTGLGFSREDRLRETSVFSSGWQMRIALAKALLEVPDILLLDEPTNYLDLEARTWLEGFLAEYGGGVLVVSHDRFFLDSVVRSVAEIYMARVSVFSGTFSQYEAVRAKQLEEILERYRRQQEEISRVEAFIRRFRYNASKAAMVQSRVKYLEKLPRIEVPPVAPSMRFRFPAPPHCGRWALILSGLAKSYGERSVFSGLDLELPHGRKLAVVGPNGAGKSTLLRILSGTEGQDAGEVRWGAGAELAFYSQENADAWTSGHTVLEELEESAPTDLIPQMRTMLGSFLFRGDDVYKPVSVLSGGEKSRVVLLKLLLHPANILILDEPTNHLDIASKDVLLANLKDFPGTVLFVSHDRHFIENLADCVLELRDGRGAFHPSDYPHFLWRSAAAEREGAAEGGEAGPEDRKGPSKVQTDRLEDKRQKARQRSLQREEEAVLASIGEAEGRRRELEELLARPETWADGERMRTLKKDLADNVKRHAGLMEEWERIAGELGS